MGNHCTIMLYHINIRLILNIFLKTLHILQRRHYKFGSQNFGYQIWFCTRLNMAKIGQYAGFCLFSGKLVSTGTDTVKTFHALPDRKSIFYNFFQFWTWSYKEVSLVLPYFSVVLPLFHQSRTEDWQVSQSLLESHETWLISSLELLLSVCKR